MKKLLLILFGVLMTFPAFAQDFTYTYEGQTITYTVTDEDAKTCETKYGAFGDAGNIVSGNLILPSNPMNGDVEYTLTCISSSSFMGCTELTSVIIPNSVKTIDIWAFIGCSNLTSVVIGNSVQNIGGRAFYNCSNLSSVIMGNSVEWIQGEAFYNCSKLTSITIPNTVKEIGDGCFYGCSSLTSVTIPDSVKTIQESAFKNCTGLTSAIIGKSVQSIGKKAFENCSNLTSVLILSTVDAAWIGVFDGCNSLIKSAYSSYTNPFPKGIAVYYPAEDAILEDGIIWNSDKTAVYFAPYDLDGEYSLPNTVETIGNSTFEGCDSLNSIIIPNSVKTIGSKAFCGCGNLTNVSMGNSVETIGDYAFEDCTGLTSFLIPGSIQSIGRAAFWGCDNLKKTAYPDTIKDPFNRYSIAVVVYPAEEGVIENGWIWNNDKTALYYAPYDLDGEYSIPNTVKTIGKEAFKDCTKLTSIIIPESVKSINESPFSGCYHLEKVDFASIESLCNIDFYWETSNPMYYTKKLYVDNQEVTDIIIPETISKINAYTFYSASNIKSVVIPESVQSIGGAAFYGCSSLSSINIPESVQSIGGSAFSGCSSLSSINIPESVQSIDDGTFRGCSSLSSINIHETIQSIGYSAFSGCSSLSSINIPESVQSIGYNAFSGCSGLTSVKVNWQNPITIYTNSFGETAYNTAILDIPENTLTTYMQSDWNQFKNIAVNGYNASRTFDDNVFKYRLIQDPNNLQAVLINGNYESMTEASIPYRFTDDSDPDNPQRYYVTAIGPEAFLNCNKLTKLSIHKDAKISEISTSAFKGCTALTNVSLSPEIKIIADSAFKDCSNMSSISLPGTISTIGDYAFYNCRYLESFNLPENLETIGESAFSMDEKFYSSYRTTNALTIPASLRRIGTDAFHYRIIDKGNINDLRAWCNIDFESGFSNPGIWSPNGFWFENEKIVDLVIPEGVEAIKQWAFVIQPTSTEWIDHVRKTSGHIKSVKIPNSVKSIEPGSFMWNGFSEITIPASVDSIGDWAFSGYNATFNHNSGNYADITLDPINVTFVDGLNPIEISSEAFSTEINRTCVSGVEASYKTYYSSPEVLYLGRPIDTLPDGFNSSIKTLTIGDILIDMPECNFSKCSNMTNLTIGNGMLEIPAEKFSNLNKLSSVTLGSSVATIGDNAFSGCTELTKITLSPSIETIGESAFAGNTKLTTISMGHGVTKIGANAFMNCPAKTVAITAQKPPVAPNNTFSDYSGDLYVQDPGDRSILDLYSDSYYCWERFNGIGMVVATRLINDSGDIPVKGEPGTKFQLSARIEPDNVTLPKIFWRSTNPLIATVDENGWVTIQDPDAYPEETVQTLSTTYGASSNECKIIAETMYANGPALEFTVQSDNSAIDEVIADGPVANNGIDYEAPYEVYNMQGMFMGNSVDNLAKGFYIVRQGQVAKKIAVK